MKKEVAKILKKILDEKRIFLKDEEIENMIEIPPSSELGDYAFPCFFLAEKLKENPSQIAIEIKEKIDKLLSQNFEKIQTNKPYINFFLNRKTLARQVILDIITQKKNYGKNKIEEKKRTMVEFPSPNTNKPLHLGHLRNMSIGESISRILEFSGEKVIRADLYNDRGIHICKAMLAYQKWGKGKTPSGEKLKSDYFVGNFYILFNKKKSEQLEKEAQEMLRKWESGDKKIISLWKLMNNWAITGFKQTYKKFGIKPDVVFFESRIYKGGKGIIFDGVKKGIFEKAKNGEIKINLEKDGLGEKILLRGDGTSIYITQDLALAKIKFNKYKLDKSFYVVGNEQEYHFKVLFSIFKKLGFEKKDMRHISYGMVVLPEGKMKSREGNIVDADDLIENVRVLAEKEIIKRVSQSHSLSSQVRKKEIENSEFSSQVRKKEIENSEFSSQVRKKINSPALFSSQVRKKINSPALFSSQVRKREKFSKAELEKRSLAIALASIKYMLLKTDIRKDILFNPKESVSFDGDTGAYILYSYARASSIIKKSPKEKKFEIKELNEKEIELVKKLSFFPDVVASAYKNLNPSLIANYSYHLAQLFNEFYNSCKVIGSEQEFFRLALVQSFQQVLKNSLFLLGIETIEEM